MRDTEAQTSIDFLIGIVIFAGIILFAFQFVGSTAAPFLSPQTADQKATEVHTVGDTLYYDKLAVEGSDSLDLSYFANSTDTGVKNETVLASELGLVPGADSVSDVKNASSRGERRELSVEVTKPGGDPVRLNGENITVGDQSIAPTARATRVGYTETNGTVVIDVEVW
jgi:hypothetical protein